jgi:hypothetical protein
MSEIYECENIETVESALASISISELENSGYPILTHTPKSKFQIFGDVREMKLGYNTESVDAKIMNFWKKIFDEDNFIRPNMSIFNPETDFLFVLHSFQDENGIDCVFKAITTSYNEFVKAPSNWINYERHGKECEKRSKGDYPTINFWDFYDHKLNTKPDKYRIPDTSWRKSFYQNLGNK